MYAHSLTWQRNMKLLEEKCWLMMKMMMVGWLHTGNRKIKATKMRTCRPWCLGYKQEKRYTINANVFWS
ncbi:unnamed protein product [Brassica napus]|uniref:(rape) hypothetical protein n=1 Tax=Brassica napus TaxID=3708 RepID=A0A816KR34_BRANA|nr:unnamed protein product [Brassica napus]CAF2072429.1 unnamed protein product [Brassica napus]